MNEKAFDTLVKAFNAAFVEYKKSGKLIKDLYWFKSEKEKDKINKTN